MILRTVIALAAAAALSAAAVAQDAPPKGLTRDQLVKPLAAWFAAEGNQDRVAELRRATGVAWVPALLEYDPAGGPRAFVWKYEASADLSADATAAAREQLRLVLATALVQKGFVTEPQATVLYATLRFERVGAPTPVGAYLPEPLPMAGFGAAHYGLGSAGDAWNGLYAAPTSYRNHFGRVRVTPIPAAYGAASGHPAGGCAYSPWAALAHSPDSLAWGETPPPVTSRRELLAGKKSADSDALYDSGLSLYWAGKYADAAEHLAAAAELGDAPPAWSYYGLAELALGHSESARAALRHAAALELASAGAGPDLRSQFERVRGDTRARLEAYRAGVTPDQAAAVLAARPALRADALTAGK